MRRRTKPRSRKSRTSIFRRLRLRSNIRDGHGATRGSSAASIRSGKASAPTPGAGRAARFLSTLMRRMYDADRVTLGAYRASRCAAGQGARAARRQSGRLGGRARLAAPAPGRSRRGADAGRRSRHRPLHAEDGRRSAVQSALANADPPALCPLEDGIGKYEPNIRALVQAMCASLAGEPDIAAGQIDDARRSRADRRDRPQPRRQSRRGGRKRPARCRSSGIRSTASPPGASGWRPRRGWSRRTG